MKTIRKKIKYTALYGFIKFLFWLAYVLPRRWTLRIYKNLGMLSHIIFTSQRMLIEKHLNFAYDIQLSKADASEFTRKLFTNIAKNTADIFIARSIKKAEVLDSLVDYEGLHYLEAAFQKGRGVIALTCHMGAFELVGNILSSRYPTNIIGKKLHNPKLNQLVVDYRSMHGGKILYSGESMLKVVRKLNKGEVVALLIDQDIPKMKGTFVKFFGKPAYTPIGAAWLALHTDAVVVPMAIRRTTIDRHLFTVLPHVEVENSITNEQSLQVNTQNFTTALEILIRQNPTQWVWMHQRWKTKPLEVIC